MNIAFFVSAHGFGHAARATAVMAALQKLDSDCVLEVFTRVPEWFFSDTLAAPFEYHSVATDVGVVQKGPFAGDAQATLERLDQFLPFSEARVRDLAAGLAARKCRAIVCDISPLGIAVAARAGVPSILVENFTWDWIYAPYLAAYPDYQPHVETLADWFKKADIHLQTEPVCRSDAGATTLFPISRSPKTGPGATRSALGVSDGSALVLLTTGGVPVRHRFLKALQDRSPVTFVVPHDVSRPSREGNVIVLPHRSAFHHPDLVRASDLVVGKLGYSTLAEVGHAGKSFGYVLRQDSVESGVLSEYAARHLKGREFAEDDFSSGRWLGSLDALLSEAHAAGPAFPNDALRAAELVLGAACLGARTSHQRPSKPFDPFNDRASRDVRNRLSQAFVEDLMGTNPDAVQRELDALMSAPVDAGCRHYIEARKAKYRQVVDKIEAGKIDDPIHQAIVIWNSGLFFECHDYLEVLWSESAGPERRALQGLIQAAGVFVHRELGRDRAADRLAARAARLLEEFGCQLSSVANIQELISALKQKGAAAPELKGR